VFEQSVITQKRSGRPLSFLASISAELIIVSALILIPLTYNEHLPDVHWKSIGVGAPVKPLRPKPVPEHLLRHASSGMATPRRFVYSPYSSLRSSSTTILAPESWDPSGINLNPDAAGPGSSLIAEISGKHAPVEPPPAIHEPAPQRPAAGPMRVSAGVQMAKLMKKVIPEYPPLAKTARISGVVHLIGIIARDGTIRNLQLVSGHPLLARAALEAVQRWAYQPTLLNGEPVEVIAPIDVYFTLGQ
jgi:protein TonB